MKMLWTGIRSIINIKSKQFYNIPQLVQNGEIVQNSKEIANIFNNYFVNIAGKIDSEIPRTRKSPLDYLGDKLEKSFFISPTNSAEVEGIIVQLKNKKSVDPYSIPCKLLKMLSHLVSPILATLINESFSGGIFPDKLKIAKVITLHKRAQQRIHQITDQFLSCPFLVRYLKKLCIRGSMSSWKKIIFCIHYNLVLEVSTPLLTHSLA